VIEDINIKTDENQVQVGKILNKDSTEEQKEKVRLGKNEKLQQINSMEEGIQ